MATVHICEGTNVLNQDPSRPMMGTIVQCVLDGHSYLVRWINNAEPVWEVPQDLTLTAKVELSEAHSR